VVALWRKDRADQVIFVVLGNLIKKKKKEKLDISTKKRLDFMVHCPRFHAALLNSANMRSMGY